MVGKPTRGDSLLDIYLVRPESALISCGMVQGISDHCGLLLDVEWAEKIFVAQEKRPVPTYHKTNVLGLQQFLQDKLPTWANNGSCIEDIWKNFKDIVSEGITGHCSILQTGHITLSSTPDQQLENHSTKYHRQQLLYNTLQLLMMGIVVPETC